MNAAVIGRVTKVAAGVLFILAVVGLAPAVAWTHATVGSLIAAGLGAWVLGEAVA